MSHGEQKVVFFENIKNELRTCFSLAWVSFHVTSGKVRATCRNPHALFLSTEISVVISVNSSATQAAFFLDQHSLNLSAACLYLSAGSISLSPPNESSASALTPVVTTNREIS